MGNLCGRQSSRDDYFASPGRTLGSANSGAAGNGHGARKSTIPKAGTGGTYVYGQGHSQNQSQNQHQSQSHGQGYRPSQGRTVGGGGGGGSSSSTTSAGGGVVPGTAGESPREAAARAAEVRCIPPTGIGNTAQPYYNYVLIRPNYRSEQNATKAKASSVSSSRHRSGRPSTRRSSRSVRRTERRVTQMLRQRRDNGGDGSLHLTRHLRRTEFYSLRVT